MSVSSFITLPALAFCLGLKHGIDPDHLAAIDGLTRRGLKVRPLVARSAGFFFSLGHGLVVIVAAALLSSFLSHDSVPAWTRLFGDCVSIFFLFALGVLNLRAALAPGAAGFRPVGMRTRFFGRLLLADNALTIAGVGGLFAISFDTLSQASLFSLTASEHADWIVSAALGVAFTIGMMTPDALNGLWIFRLANHADRRTSLASRAVGLVVASISLAIAGIELAGLLNPHLGGVMSDWRLGIGLGVVAAATLGATFAIRLPAGRNGRRVKARPCRSGPPAAIPRPPSADGRAGMETVNLAPASFCPDPSAMTFDDRPAHEEADAHPAALGRVEGH